ncbi:MAG: PorV/PorQ family protein [Balneolaceae bacterium]|nr:PorV/PorQ family protein [Balneolaceae bacterium]
MTKSNKILFTFACLMACILPFGSVTYAQSDFGEDRAGTEGFQFTKIPIDPRSAAMGNSNMADAVDGSSLFWNPALAARLTGSNVMLNHTQYFADISLEYLSYIHKTGKFAIGGSVQYLSSGDIKETTEFDPFGTGRTFGTQHISIGLTGSHQITDLFSYGITLRYITERFIEVQYNTGAIDFGFSYLVGETGLRFAVGINNFGFDASPEGSVTDYGLDGEEKINPKDDLSLPTRFNIGAAYDVIESKNNKLTLTAQITNPSDNSEQLNIGAEYGFVDQFFLRGGYEFGINERQWPSFGAGIKVPFSNRELHADYGYTVYERLGGIHRIGVSISL